MCRRLRVLWISPHIYIYNIYIYIILFIYIDTQMCTIIYICLIYIYIHILILTKETWLASAPDEEICLWAVAKWKKNWSEYHTPNLLLLTSPHVAWLCGQNIWITTSPNTSERSTHKKIANQMTTSPSHSITSSFCSLERFPNFVGQSWRHVEQLGMSTNQRYSWL